MRFMPKFSETTFFCFSLPVMLFILILEFLFALYVIITSKWRHSSAIVITILLVCLGIFQLAEFQVCDGARTVAWMRLGYTAITLLPALGIHLVSLITRRKWVRNLGYLLAAGFISVFLFSTQSIHTALCGGNYILISTSGVVARTYFPLYYLISLTVTILEIIWFTIVNVNQNKIAVSALRWLLGGLATFLIPTGAVYLLSTAARSGLPSIMCGFAVFFAIILTLFVYPLYKKLDI